MSSTTVKRYGLALKKYAGSLDPKDYLQRETAEELEEFVGRDSWDSTIVELDITITFPEPELPTTPGSLIRATLDQEWSDSEVTVTLALSDDEDSEAWYAITQPATGEYFSASVLRNVEILFDAATIK